MDDDIFHSIESNGRAVVHVYYEGQRVEVPGTKVHLPSVNSLPELKVTKLPDGAYMASVDYEGKSANIKDNSFRCDVWSFKHQAFYFIEEENPSITGRGWLCRWTVTKGFEKLKELSGYAISASLSLDQSAVVIDEYGASSDSQSSFLVYTMADGKLEKIPRPDWAAHPVMTGYHQFLLRRHDTGHEGHVVRWVPGKPDKDTANSDLRVDGGLMIDVADLDGEIWAIQVKNGKSSIVRLNRNLSKVVQDVGWVEEAEQPRRQP